MKRNCLLFLFLFGGIGLSVKSLYAAPCDRLSQQQKKISQKLFKSIHPYDCCDETIEQCLKQKKVCKLVKRLRDDICRRLTKGQNETQIQNALKQRARSMLAFGKKAIFDLAHAPIAGDPSAPVTVVAYACARCPFCSRVVPDLYRLVTQGGLKGRAKLHFRPFPIRSHAGSLEGGLAIISATQMNKLWPFLLILYGEYSAFSVNKLGDWAAKAGMDRKKFKTMMAKPDVRRLLIESKKEGLRNGVDATPTLFINGRKYYGSLDRESLLDVLDEEFDRVNKKQFCGK